MTETTLTSGSSPLDRLGPRPLVITLILLVLGLVYVYWNSLLAAADKWDTPQYSHGYLVPLFALGLLWFRWQPLESASPSARWTGLGLLAGGLLMRLAAAYVNMVIPDMVSLLPCLAGVFLMVGGWRTIRWAWPVVGFLVFMFPLPDILERGLLTPLQEFATICSNFLLQTLGLPAYREGNRILLGELQMGVVDACSGLRMLTIFIALACGIALITERPWWEKLLIIISAVPIALLVNILRITVTGILHRTVGSEIANKVFHDLAGWVMMPMALGLLYVELVLLSHLLIEDQDYAEAPLDIGGGPSYPGANAA